MASNRPSFHPGCRFAPFGEFHQEGKHGSHGHDHDSHAAEAGVEKPAHVIAPWFDRIHRPQPIGHVHQHRWPEHQQAAARQRHDPERRPWPGDEARDHRADARTRRQPDEHHDQDDRIGIDRILMHLREDPGPHDLEGQDHEAGEKTQPRERQPLHCGPRYPFPLLFFSRGKACGDRQPPRHRADRRREQQGQA
jgi:hypothetical protein